MEGRCEVGQSAAVPSESIRPLTGLAKLRDDLAYAQADARHWHAAFQWMDAEALRLSEQAREFARQARAGERLRVAVRSLEQNASAGLIHWSGEATDVVRAEDLRVALDGERGQ